MRNTNTAPDNVLPKEMEFNLSDFALFLSVMKNKDAYESILSIIMDDPDLRLTQIRVEEVVLNKTGKRAIRLDAWAMDSHNVQYDTEMENDTSHDDVRKRSRFYQGILDSTILKSGRRTRYKELPSTVIIFITQTDIFKKDLAMYTFTEQCEEVPGLSLEDGTKKIFLNMTSKNGRAELISLLQYMKESRLDNPEILVKDERILKLDAVVDEVKQSEEWEDVKMSILSIGIERGREEGRKQGMREGILNFLSDLGPVPQELRLRILDQKDPDILQKWLRLAARARSADEFAGTISKDYL